MTMIRLALALVVFTTSASIVIIHGCAVRHAELSLDEVVYTPPASGAVSEKIDSIVETASEAFQHPESSVTDPDSLLDDVRVTLIALWTLESGPYYQHRTESGMDFRRDILQEMPGMAQTYGNRGVPDIPSDLSDEDALDNFWRTAVQRRAAIRDVIPGETHAGRGLTPILRTEGNWPYHTAWAIAAPLFVADSKPLGRTRGNELDGTEHSAYVLVRVIFEDGSEEGLPGYIRLAYAYLDEHETWIPVVVHTGADEFQGHHFVVF